MKRTINNKKQNGKMDKVAASIAATILKWQQLYTKDLENLTKNWHQRHQLIFLCLICLAFGGLSTMLVVNSLWNRQSPNLIITKSISLPKRIYTKDKPFQITDKEFQQLQEYKYKHSELFKVRPGLYDSLQQIEKIYYSQKK